MRNQIIEAIHAVNFNGGLPPKFVFKDKREVSTDTVNRVKETARMLPVSQEWAYNELAVPAPKEGQIILEIADEAKGISPSSNTDFSTPNLGQQFVDFDEFDDFDTASHDEIALIWAFAQNAESLDELQQTIANTFPNITQGALSNVAKAAFELEFLQGMTEASIHDK